AHAGRPGRRLVRAGARAVSARRGVGRCRVGFAAARRGAVRPRSRSSRGQLGGGGAHCTTRAAGRGAPGDRAVAGGGRAARHGRGVRVVPLGVPRRSERGGVSGGGSCAGGLAADRGGGGGAGGGGGGDELGRGAPRGAGGAGPGGGCGGGASGEHGAARSLVAVRSGDRGVRDGVGVAPPAGPALMASLWQRLGRVFARGDAGAREEAERILLEADFGVAATAEILEQVARTPDGDARRALEQAVVSILSKAGAPGALARASEPPTVMLVFGVNGVGKTTTIAKLAHRLVRDGRSVLLAAADTFRAGAREQLEIWANRLGVPCIRGGGAGAGADPAAVAFDAVAAARARGIDSVL